MLESAQLVIARLKAAIINNVFEPFGLYDSAQIEAISKAALREQRVVVRADVYSFVCHFKRGRICQFPGDIVL